MSCNSRTIQIFGVGLYSYIIFSTISFIITRYTINLILLWCCQLEYDIRGVAPATDFFSIDTSSGIIRIKKMVNKETATLYTVSTTCGQAY